MNLDSLIQEIRSYENWVGFVLRRWIQELENLCAIYGNPGAYCVRVSEGFSVLVSDTEAAKRLEAYLDQLKK